MSNFAEEFTRLEPVYSPAGSPPSGDSRIFQVSESQPGPWLTRGHYINPVLIRTQYRPPGLSACGDLELSVMEITMAGHVFELHGLSLNSTLIFLLLHHNSLLVHKNIVLNYPLA